jgi:DNA-binding SARP family transcriptional activator
MSIEIRLLGGFEVRRGALPVEGFESKKVRALFAYLLLDRDQRVPRERLAALLWPEQSDESARRNLRQAVYKLR